MKGYKGVIPSEPVPVHFKLEAGGHRVSGFGGCNRFTGTWRISDHRIKFGPLATTRKHCAFGMGVERGLFEAMESNDTYAIKGNTLELIRQGKTTVKFVTGNHAGPAKK